MKNKLLKKYAKYDLEYNPNSITIKVIHSCADTISDPVECENVIIKMLELLATNSKEVYDQCNSTYKHGDPNNGK